MEPGGRGQADEGQYPQGPRQRARPPSGSGRSAVRGHRHRPPLATSATCHRSSASRPMWPAIVPGKLRTTGPDGLAHRSPRGVGRVGSPGGGRLGWPQPQRDLGRLRGLVDHSAQLGNEYVQIGLRAQLGNKRLDRALSVVPAPVEPPVDRILNPSTCRQKIPATASVATATASDDAFPPPRSACGWPIPVPPSTAPTPRTIAA